MKLRLIKRTIKSKKYYIVAISVFIIYSIMLKHHNNNLLIKKLQKLIEDNKRHKLDVKYILKWTDPYIDPLFRLREGQDVFIERQCPYTNCFVLTERTVLNITDYDVITFHAKEIMNNKHVELPKIRTNRQLYVFASLESSGYFPVGNNRFDDFFNLTWSYRLDSNKYSGYIAIRDDIGNLIGPKEIMHWKDVSKMKPINDNIKSKLKHKKIAAAWFVSNCYTPGKRETYVEMLRKELNNFGLSIDVYGWCGNLNCPRDRIADCLKLLERDYYFYLSFENSYSKDYVTEKLLYALQNYAVPIVYGGANYTRFMPDGIYLDARKLRPKALAVEMSYLINVKEKYYDYFKWHNHYSYHDVEEVPETDPFCGLCTLINEQKHANVYNNFRKWWDQ